MAIVNTPTTAFVDNPFVDKGPFVETRKFTRFIAPLLQEMEI